MFRNKLHNRYNANRAAVKYDPLPDSIAGCRAATRVDLRHHSDCWTQDPLDLVSDKFSPFEVYERERREPRIRFVTRERLQKFVDALSLE